MLTRLQDNLSVLSAELVPLHERLVTIRRKLVTLAAKGGSSKAELKPLQEDLRKIDSLSIIFFSHQGTQILTLHFCPDDEMSVFALAAPLYACHPVNAQ